MRLDNPMLVIDGVELPPVSGDKYAVRLIALEKSKETIGGTIVREWRGMRREITYSIDYMPSDLGRLVLEKLRSGKVLTVQYLPDDGDLPEEGEFICTVQPSLKAAFPKGGKLLWHNFSFTLQSVKAEC